MKIKSDIVVQKVGGSYLAVAVGKRAEEISGMIKLNESAMFLWNTALDHGVDADKLADALVGEYGITREEALTDAKAFVQTLIEKRIAE